jgi:hypothetical protein
MFARAGPSLEVLAKPNIAVVFRVTSGKPGKNTPMPTSSGSCARVLPAYL